ncbi:MAG: HDOD domain-containing protein [Nevskia sp.]|nr:HDOD domain-containing protein [Nevskia sp.]
MNQHYALESKVMRSVNEALRLNALKLPSLPEVAGQVQAIAADPGASIDDLAGAILRDAALTARLIRIANSPLLRGRVEVRTLPQAITRLGIYYVRDLVIALTMEHAFEPRSSAVRQMLQRIWRRSKDVAAICHVLARHRTLLPAEQAMLAGLLHLIGALPLLASADEDAQAPVDPVDLFVVIEAHHGQIGGRILRQWHFRDEIAGVPEAYREHARPGGEAADFADVVSVANLLCAPFEGHVYEIPDWGSYPAARKLGLASAADFYSSEQMQLDLQRSMNLFS